MRSDQLARLMSAMNLPVSKASAVDMLRRGVGSLSGAEVADSYGLLAHYTRSDLLHLIHASGQIGHPGLWLTPTAYSACMAPYNLGLDTPCDTCLLINVRNVEELWGPGTTPGSLAHSGIWQGGGIEFFCPQPIPLSAVVDTQMVEPCGGGHYD